MKQSVNTTFSETKNLFQEYNLELKRNVERLEKYSRDFNIRVVGVVEQDGEDCLLIIRNYSISHFLASKMTLVKLSTPTALVLRLISCVPIFLTLPLNKSFNYVSTIINAFLVHAYEIRFPWQS